MDSSVVPWLNCPFFDEYRLTYRRFRQGHSRGATGDASDVGLKAIVAFQAEDEISDTLTHASSLRSNESLAIEPQSLEFMDNQDPRMLKVTQWRLQYRRFRMGQARGSVGELVAVVPEDIDLTFLPVVQHIRLRRQGIRGGASQIQSRQSLPGDDKALHIHIGSGKLGLGLILKTLVASSRRFVLLQNARGMWVDLNTVPLWTNGEVSYSSVDIEFSHGEATQTLGVVHGTLASLDQLYICWEMWPVIRGWIVVTSAVEEKKLLIQSCTTLSISVGASGVAAVGDLLEEVLDPLSPPLTLFACENDHSAVARLQDRLKTKVNVIACMVDRICSAVEHVKDEQNMTKIKVHTEPYAGEIVVLEAFTDGLPFGGKEVKSPTLDIQRNYFADRKFLLVNGGHTTLAFLTMLRYHDNESGFVPPGCDALLDWGTCTTEERATLWSFTVARLLLILWQYDIEVLKDAHQVESDEELVEALLSYAKQTVLRFSAIPDTTNRILNGGVENRFHGRLRNIEDFIDMHFDGLNIASRKLLEACGCRLTSLITTIHTFVSRCKQFVHLTGPSEIILPNLAA